MKKFFNVVAMILIVSLLPIFAFPSDVSAATEPKVIALEDMIMDSSYNCRIMEDSTVVTSDGTVYNGNNAEFYARNHWRSYVCYDLDGMFKSFEGTVTASSKSINTHFDFAIFCDNQTVYSASISNTQPLHFNIDLTGVGCLIIFVNSADGDSLYLCDSYFTVADENSTYNLYSNLSSDLLLTKNSRVELDTLLVKSSYGEYYLSDLRLERDGKYLGYATYNVRDFSSFSAVVFASRKYDHYTPSGSYDLNIYLDDVLVKTISNLDMESEAQILTLDVSGAKKMKLEALSESAKYMDLCVANTVLKEDNPTRLSTETPKFRLKISSHNFPDENFRAYLKNIDPNGDGYITEEEIPVYSKLDCSDRNISSLEGIEKLYFLKSIRCSYNHIVNIDLSKNTNLLELYCSNNSITNLDLSSNTKLIDLDCGSNKLLKLDVTKCKDLKQLYCYENQLTVLDISNNPSLQILSCFENKLTDLDLTKNAELTDLYVNNNSLTNLIINKCSKLETLMCSGNKIANLDLANNKLLLDATKKDKYVSGNILNYFTAGDYDYLELSNGDCVYFDIDFGFLSIDKSTTLKNGKDTIGAATPKPTAKPTATPKPSSDSGVAGFAERLYTTCLGRDSEKAGKEYWVSELKMGKTGAEVAYGFFFSDEINRQNLSNKEYITRLYKTFMNRTPDSDGMDYWLDVIKSNNGREKVFYGFVNSTEWADICLKYGIKSGGTAVPSFEKQASKEVQGFAERLYTTCLGRKAESDGLKYWSQELANMRVSGTSAAYGFFFSSEFKGMKLSNKEFITRLYKTFMNRDPEKNGFNYWIDQMDNGATREQVFYGFANATEFAEICGNAGIIA